MREPRASASRRPPSTTQTDDGENDRIPSPGGRAGLLGLRLGRPLGKRGGLTLGRTARLLQLGLEAFVVLTKAFVVPAELSDLGAEFLQVLEEADRHRHRLADLDL